MLRNMNYNLMEEITELSQSLYRYDRYIENAKADSGGCTECHEIWVRLRQRHEEDLGVLLEQLKHHIDEGLLDLPSRK